jgi:NADH-quinone oxidoreductase E subunit
MSTIQENPSGQKPKFSPQALQEAENLFKRYPPGKEKQSALLPMLHLAQREFGGWLSQDALDYVAQFLELPPIRVYEVATFYTMYNLKPVGKYHVQICTNISCWLCGSDDIVQSARDKLKIGFGETTKDNKFTLSQVECLGACVNAPMMQINDDYHEELTPEKTAGILDQLP